MPIVIPNKLPANDILRKEGIFVMNEKRALHQDIRPLEIAILNLMPTKIETETQLLRLLGNTPIQLHITLLKTSSYESKNTSKDHMESFYKTFEEVKDQNFDGLIITGAPVENIPFEEVEYWDELQEIMKYSKEHVTSTLHICWGAQAGLYYHYGISKEFSKEKIFGVFRHEVIENTFPITRGFDDFFMAPHSRYTGNSRAAIEKCPNLNILAYSQEAGVYLVTTDAMDQVFVTGHSEYDEGTLDKEYQRDIKKGLVISPPTNYYRDNLRENGIMTLWKSHANLLFSNWINYCVYQKTPFELN